MAEAKGLRTTAREPASPTPHQASATGVSIRGGAKARARSSAPGAGVRPGSTAIVAQAVDSARTGTGCDGRRAACGGLGSFPSRGQLVHRAMIACAPDGPRPLRRAGAPVLAALARVVRLSCIARFFFSFRHFSFRHARGRTDPAPRIRASTMPLDRRARARAHAMRIVAPRIGPASHGSGAPVRARARVSVRLRAAPGPGCGARAPGTRNRGFGRPSDSARLRPPTSLPKGIRRAPRRRTVATPEPSGPPPPGGARDVRIARGSSETARALPRRGEDTGSLSRQLRRLSRRCPRARGLG